MVKITQSKIGGDQNCGVLKNYSLVLQ